MGCNVSALEPADTLQLYRGLSAIDTYEGVTSAGADIVMRLQPTEAVTFHVQRISGRKVRNQMLSTCLLGDKLK